LKESWLHFLTLLWPFHYVIDDSLLYVCLLTVNGLPLFIEIILIILPHGVTRNFVASRVKSVYLWGWNKMLAA